MNTITFSQAVIGYTIYAQARCLSPHTIADYANTFRKFTAHLQADLPLGEITAAHVRDFLNAQAVSKKTKLNFHVGLSALWTWALKEQLVTHHIVRDVEPPKPDQRAIVPFTETDVRALLAAVGKSKTYARPGKRECRHSLNTVERTRAILLLMLDTGLRESELCALTLANTDLSNKRILVMGKGAKERILPFSASTAQALWRYITVRPEPAGNTASLFLSHTGRTLRRHDIIKLCHRVGDCAGVPDCYPHRFRHTFSIQFLRGGGNAYSLQAMLGHSSLEMVRRYIQIAQTDIEAAHRIASPVANWRL